jgi:hypothetical protein
VSEWIPHHHVGGLQHRIIMREAARCIIMQRHHPAAIMAVAVNIFMFVVGSSWKMTVHCYNMHCILTGH